MRPFLHQRLQQQAALLAQSGQVLDKFQRQDLDLPDAGDALLAQAIATWHGLGLALRENEARAGRAELAAARQGLDPASGQRVAQHRRELQRGVALRVLLGLAERLREDMARDEAGLAQGRQALQPMLLLAREQGLWPPAAGPAPGGPTQAELEALWQAMRDHPALGTAARQLAMGLAAADVLLLMEALLPLLA